MKHSIASSGQSPEMRAEDKIFNSKTSYPEDHSEVFDFCPFTCSYPFIPLMDLTWAFDELRRIIKYRLFKKEKIQTDTKNKIHENI
ncbi:hypothetical protein ACR1PO_03935 [Chryseobacterium sp. RRHN12]|uniref:hypothetical protein n=1 Tax=Chryseobacterium sp. RRHN12 TaxID=3437884 RepID=UPI002FC82918